MAEKIARKPLGRFIILAVVLLMMMGTLLTTLYGLTIKNGDYYTENAEKEATNTIVTRGRRGTIYDCNGLVLAYDETCYNVCFMRDGDNRSDYDSAVYTEALIEAIKIINEGGSETIVLRLGQRKRTHDKITLQKLLQRVRLRDSQKV